MEDHRPVPQDVTIRAARCCACGRPVWPLAGAPERDGVPTPPELCDYCMAARQ
jgi:hypothetical protein